MIESIEFKNFKALKDTTLPLSRFTLIIGPNGSGKSTALQALQLVHKPGNKSFNEVASINLKPSEAQVDVIVNWSEPYPRMKTWSRWIPYRYEGPNYNIQSENEINTLNTILREIPIYSFDPQVISLPAKIQQGVTLGKNGAQLAGVLDDIKDLYEDRFEDLNKEISRLLPEFERILFEKIGEGTKAFLLRTKEGHHKIPAKDLSEGTLLALALLTLAYLPKPPTVICIEEPDRGIHPRLLRDVKDALYRLAYPEVFGEKREPVQVIATTHSPYLLDLYKEHPEEIVIANKIGQEVKFERLSDRPHYEEIMQDISLGDAWYTGILGGVPAHP